MDSITPSNELASETKLLLREQAEGIVRGMVLSAIRRHSQALPQDEDIVRGMVLSTESLKGMSPDAVRALAHELQVHQIELAMQNETLRQTQLQLLAMQARYFDLYDLAPISYCTVNALGVILEANLATAELLGEARNSLVGQRINRYISKDFQDSYYLCHQLLLSTNVRQSCELYMKKANGTAVWVKASIASAECSNGDPVLRMVLTDISDAKIMALAMQESESRLRAIVETQG
jgi:PAS domain S-box-containing protein